VGQDVDAPRGAADRRVAPGGRVLALAFPGAMKKPRRRFGRREKGRRQEGASWSARSRSSTWSSRQRSSATIRPGARSVQVFGAPALDGAGESRCAKPRPPRAKAQKEAEEKARIAEIQRQKEEEERRGLPRGASGASAASSTAGDHVQVSGFVGPPSARNRGPRKKTRPTFVAKVGENRQEGLPRR